MTISVVPDEGSLLPEPEQTPIHLFALRNGNPVCRPVEEQKRRADPVEMKDPGVVDVALGLLPECGAKVEGATLYPAGPAQGVAFDAEGKRDQVGEGRNRHGRSEPVRAVIAQQTL